MKTQDQLAAALKSALKYIPQGPSSLRFECERALASYEAEKVKQEAEDGNRGY